MSEENRIPKQPLPKERVKTGDIQAKQNGKISDDAQLASIDLQMGLDRQQSAIQTMHNIAKAVQDNGQAIVKKMKD
jgi:hypothetical protein